MVYLTGLRYRVKIQEECDSVEEARALAERWSEETPYEPYGYASPTAILDEDGNVIEKI